MNNIHIAQGLEQKKERVEQMRKVQHTRKICLGPWTKGIRVAGST